MNPTQVSLIGSRISHYRIVSLLGKGGMGVVYRASDERLDRDLALKVLLTESATDVNARARLVREARMASSLNHPHIAHVYEVGEDHDHLFIAMELVEGQTLSASIAGGLPPDTLLRHALQIADALAHAHERGVIHRDLKSTNIMLTSDGWVKVLDFGLAKRLPAAAGEAETQDLSLTASGIVLGTPNHLPPEILRGEQADARSDIWSLGVVLYEMASGRVPFGGGSFAELSEAILIGQPTPLSGRVPIGIQAVIGRCLAKDPSQRYRSGSEVRAAIEALIGASAPKKAGGLVSRLLWIIPAALLGIGLLVAALAVGTGAVRNPFKGGADRPRFSSLAVLPLANLSGDPAQEYFADGMTEELITDLASIQALKVISRTSVMRFKGSKEPLTEIARSLDVDAIVEGSVQRAGDRVRITAQLIEASSDRHLWAKSFERDFRDVLALQSEVAREIAKEIQLQISPQASARSQRPIHPEAYELYLKGRFEWSKLTEVGVRQSIGYFERALALDPGDARYSSGLADAYVVLVQVLGSMPTPEGMAKVKEYARRALAADENSAEAHTSIAAALFFGDWDSKEAERHLLRAIELNPSYSTAHLVYSAVLATASRIDEAIEQDRQAIARDPFSLIINWNAVGTLFIGRRYDEAMAQVRHALEVIPGSPLLQGTMLRIYEHQGNYEAALDLMEKALPEKDGGKAQAARLRQAYVARGPAGYWQAVLDHTLEMAKTHPMPPIHMAFLYTHVGDHSKALDYIERAYAEHSGDMLFIKVEPAFDPLRGEPRFQALVKRMEPRLLPAQRS
ncbi:MAG TPA: protein kinase [Candidatus Eisenbacteria bacterium]|nr:protein kinase [Candidatus Eisenbacteria bacterium]